MMFEYETVFPFLKSGSILVSDDTRWNTAFDDFCQKYTLSPVQRHGYRFIHL
jgi:hypothetical protein